MFVLVNRKFILGGGFMINPLMYALLLALIFLVGCSNQSILDYDDDDVAAIVNGEEITIRDLRFLYADEKVLDNIDGTVKARSVMQEAKQIGLDVSQEINEETEVKSDLPPKDTDDPARKSIR